MLLVALINKGDKMLIGTEKLRRAGDRQAIERIQEKKELISLRKELALVIKEKEAAELDAKNKTQRNMCLTRNAGVSHCWMIYSNMISFCLCGLFVYTL